MQPNRLEFQKQCAFQSFCKRALRNEAANAHKEIKRRRAKEVSFSDLTPQEQDQLCTYDSYFTAAMRIQSRATTQRERRSRRSS